MPTYAQQPIDVQWDVELVSAVTLYTRQSAIAAGVTLSAGNANAPVQVCQTQQTVTNGTGTTPLNQSNVQIDTATPQANYLVKLSSATTYYPLATAVTQAYATSTANANAPVYVSRVMFTLTAP